MRFELKDHYSTSIRMKFLDMKFIEIPCLFLLKKNILKKIHVAKVPHVAFL